MPDRIQGQAAGAPSGIVAEVFRHEAVRDLVNDDRHNQYGYIKNCVGCVHVSYMIA